MNNLLRYHPRILVSLFAGIVVYFCLPTPWPAITRVLVSWDGAVGLFLILIYLWMRGQSAEHIRSQYIEEDPSARTILVIVVCAALLSVVAIVHPLATLKEVKGGERVGHIALAAITLVNSWLLVPTIFSTHYADMFYSAAEDDRPLKFPNTPMPAFWDFVYFSFTIAAACQTSDVSTENQEIRKIVTMHTLVSFFFNLAVLGFAINVTAGLIGG